MKRNSLDMGDDSRAVVRMARHVLCEILMTIGTRQPETGGLLLGPIDSMDITDFYFDRTADCTSGTYTPDYMTLRKKMQSEWQPSGLDMKGFVHSHPGQFDQLSGGDKVYIKRLLERNLDMPWFVSPIVIPYQFRLRVWIVPQGCPDVAVEARLVLFSD